MKKILLLLLGILAFSSIAEARMTCSRFDTQAEAQRYFDAHRKGYRSLDGDHDGEPCECLSGGSSYDKSVCERWRRKHGK